MDNAVDPKLLDKLNKLINHQESAASLGNTAEAEAFAAKVQDLLLKHNLDMQEVVDAGIQAKATMANEEFDLDKHQTKSEAGWLEKLIQAVAHYSLCKVVKSGRRRHAYDQGILIILGEKHNVAIVFYLVEQLISKIDIACKMAWKQYTGYEKRNTFRRGFLVGAVDAIHVRMHQEEFNARTRDAAERQAKGATHTNTMALMIVDKRKQAEDYMDEIFPSIRRVNKKETSLSSRDGKIRGWEAGSKMELNRGMGGSKAKGNLE